jgi:adenylylsulfate kinase
MLEKLTTIICNRLRMSKRSIAKTISYRFISIVFDFSVLYLFTGQIKVALGFTAVSNLYSALLYFFHERIWNKIKWGKQIHKSLES